MSLPAHLSYDIWTKLYCSCFNVTIRIAYESKEPQSILKEAHFHFIEMPIGLQALYTLYIYNIYNIKNMMQNRKNRILELLKLLNNTKVHIHVSAKPNTIYKLESVSNPLEFPTRLNQPDKAFHTTQETGGWVKHTHTNTDGVNDSIL